MKNKSIRIMAAIIVLTVLFAGNNLHPVNATAKSASSIEKTGCSSFQDARLSEPEWECGYLIVPENRSNPQSRTIKVAFSLLKATGVNPQSDPVVYLAGGPGASAIDSGWADWGNSPLGNRDLILVDPRGVGYSQPEMECPGETTPDLSKQDRIPSAEETMALRLQWAQSCRDLLISQGFDLTAYNSLANAKDLDDLRQALGYPVWNLYGISYGTRIALVTMREFPDGIRSAILDSVLPPQADRIGGDLTTTTGSLSAMFSTCKADPACNGEYPDLETEFYEAIRKLDQDPIKITVPDGDTGKMKQVGVTGALIALGVRESMLRTGLAQIMPITISRIYAGDRDILEKIIPFLAPLENPANYNTVLCHDMSSLYDPNTFSENLEKRPELKSLYAAYSDGPICEIWGAGQADLAASQPVQSDIPTLILNGGDFDPATPPAYAKLAASTLSRSYLFIFQNSTHGVSFDECSRAMMADFLENPSSAPDSSCMAQVRGLYIITDVYPNKGALNIFLRVQEPYSPFSLAIGLIGLIFLSVIIGLPIIYFRSRRQTIDVQATPKLARLTLWLASTLNLIFIVGVWILSKKALAENYGWVTLVGFSPLSSRFLFLLPLFTSLLAVVLLVFTILAWRNQWWKRLELVLFSLGTLGVLSLSGILIYLRALSV
jgi:pimeloyl-ACP methyl ester carboxylesterase